MARKRRAKDYQRDESAAADAKQRPRMTLAQAKQDVRNANQQEGSPGILVIAVLAVTVFIAFYYHILALQGMQQLTGGMPMLDHHPSGFTVTDVEHLAERMDDDALGQYNWVHITAGRIFPIMQGLSIVAVALWTLRSKLAKWGAVVVAVGYVVLDIASSIRTEIALADVTEANVAIASSLTIAQWLLLIFTTIGIVVLLILKFVGRNSPGLEPSLDPERRMP